MAFIGQNQTAANALVLCITAATTGSCTASASPTCHALNTLLQSHSRVRATIISDCRVSNSRQSAIPCPRIFTVMKDGIRLLNVELDGDDGVVVTFSDGTTDAYVAEELLELRPYRERLRNRKIFDVPTKGPSH